MHSGPSDHSTNEINKRTWVPRGTRDQSKQMWRLLQFSSDKQSQRSFLNRCVLMSGVLRPRCMKPQHQPSPWADRWTACSRHTNTAHSHWRTDSVSWLPAQISDCLDLKYFFKINHQQQNFNMADIYSWIFLKIERLKLKSIDNVTSLVHWCQCRMHRFTDVVKGLTICLGLICKGSIAIGSNVSTADSIWCIKQSADHHHH